MHNRFFFVMSAVVVLSSAAVSAAGFEAAYDAAGALPDKSSLVLKGQVSPTWTGDDQFRYSTLEKSGTVHYLVDIRKGTRQVISPDSLRAAPVNSFRRPEGFGPGRRPGLSPDGRFECVIRDHNLWIRPAGEADFRQLSTDGSDADGYVQFRWSPDSRYIAALRKQAHKMRQVLLRESKPDDQIQPKYRWIDYDKPGDDLPQATPVLFDVIAMRSLPYDTTPFLQQYELRMGQWHPTSAYFTFEYNQRGHQLYQLVALYPRQDDVEVRILAEEKSETFVYYNDLWRQYADDGSYILWISERDDWRHLYRIDGRNGGIRQLTRGAWNVREILHVDQQHGIVLMYANGYRASEGEDPYNKHLLRLNMANGKIVDLTPENGNHSVSFNPGHTYFVDNWSRPDQPYQSVVRRADTGKTVMKLQQSDISGLMEAGYTLPEVFVAKGRDGKTDIWGNIYRPMHFDPSKSYPVIEYIYAGPHDSFVDKDFLLNQRYIRLVDMGFIVVCIDGMGTDNRSKSFQDVAWRNLKDAGFPDRIRWIEAAAQKYPYMNIDRVGIYGYSAGGQNALSALLFHPEFYKVAVALCGCHDNRMDKIWWNEQWMGYPVGPWYSENSNVDNAYRLEGRLFLINGEMDDNVDPASTLQVVAELVRHNKDFEQLYLPGFSHNLNNAYVSKRVFRFFWDHCKVAE